MGKALDCNGARACRRSVSAAAPAAAAATTAVAAAAATAAVAATAAAATAAADRRRRCRHGSCDGTRRRRCSRPRSAADRAASAPPLAPSRGRPRRAAAGAEAACSGRSVRRFCTKRWSKVCCSGLGMRLGSKSSSMSLVARRRAWPARAAALPPPSTRRLVVAARALLAVAIVALAVVAVVAVAARGRCCRAGRARRGAGRRLPVAASLRCRVALRIGEAADRADIGFVEVDPDAALQAARQHHGAVADADQAADGQADRLEQLAHFAVAAFGDDDAVPVVERLRRRRRRST